MPSEKGKGITGTILIHLGLLAILVIVAFSAPKPPEETGIIVNFGTDETGTGLIEPSPAASNEETTQPLKSQSETPSKEEAIVTQNFDKEAPEVKKVDPEAEKKRKEQIEAEKVRKAQEEADRIKKARDEAEKRRIAEEEKRTNDILNRTKNALSNAKNTGTNSTSEGVNGGLGNQGVPTGSVNSDIRGPGGGTGDNGISFDLAGRNFQALPPPKYDYQGEGRVVVEIIVDRTGNVTTATPGVKGSTTLDEYLLSAAKDAALKAKFESKPDAPVIQRGTITYNFKLK